MKRTILFNTFLSGIFLLSLLSSCSDAPKGDQVKIAEQAKPAEAVGLTFVLDTSTSRIHFTGHGVGKNHPGTFHLSSGSVAITGNQVTGGEFLINIKSMEMKETGAGVQQKLRPHLMSGDFFDAAKFGTAKFVITKVEPYRAGNTRDTSIIDGANFYVSGNFTLKEDTKNITFPAKIDLDGNTLKAKANFDIDRTQWRMNYGNDKTLGDKFISEKVNVRFELEAKK